MCTTTAGLYGLGNKSLACYTNTLETELRLQSLGFRLGSASNFSVTLACWVASLGCPFPPTVKCRLCTMWLPRFLSGLLWSFSGHFHLKSNIRSNKKDQQFLNPCSPLSPREDLYTHLCNSCYLKAAYFPG